MICLYVDDLLINGSNSFEIEYLKDEMKAKFEMFDLGKLSCFLGMKFVKVKEGVIIHQQKYATELLDRFN